MKDTILEGNKLIASFMGWELISDITEDYPDQKWLRYENKVTGEKYHSTICVTPPSKYDEAKRTKEFENDFHGSFCKYNSSWNWLMPVVERIESLGCLMSICEDICTLSEPKNKIVSGVNKMDATYKAIVYYITNNF